MDGQQPGDPAKAAQAIISSCEAHSSTDATGVEHGCYEPDSGKTGMGQNRFGLAAAGRLWNGLYEWNSEV